MNDDALLANFVDAFGRNDDLLLSAAAPVALRDGIDSEVGLFKWRPVRIATAAAEVDKLYRDIPGPFPALYVRLISSFRWLDVYLTDTVLLLGNPPGPTLTALGEAMQADRMLVDLLFPKRLVPFGRAGDTYDPICFDLSGVSRSNDWPIVQVDHEAILCDDRIGEVWPRYDSFRSLVNEICSASEAGPT